MNPSQFLAPLNREFAFFRAVHHEAGQSVIDEFRMLSLMEENIKEPHAKGHYVLLEDFILRGLIDHPIPHFSQYQLSDIVCRFVEFITHQYRLGVTESIQGYIKNLDEDSGRLYQAAKDVDDEAFRQAIINLQSRVNDIRTDIKHNHSAIQARVSEAKQSSEGLPIKSRYARIIDTWDRYVTPLNNLIGIDKPFQRQLDTVKHRLVRTQELVEQDGRMHSQKVAIDYLNTVVSSLQGQLQHYHHESQRILMPLYNRARKHDDLSRWSSAIVSTIRTGGLDGLEQTHSLSSPAPGIHSYTISDHELMRLFSEYGMITETEIPTIPTLSESLGSELDHINTEQIMDALLYQLPVTDFLHWIRESYAELSMIQALEVFSYIINKAEGVQRIYGKQPHTYHFKDSAIKAYPVRMEVTSV